MFRFNGLSTFLATCWLLTQFVSGSPQAAGQSPAKPANQTGPQPDTAAAERQLQAAIFAGGCFWCVESAFDKVEGVVETISGYTGGKTQNPTYDAVSQGRTGHYEAVRIVYDPQQTNYEKLLYVFWRNIDPFNARGQFCDSGSQYRAAIFVDSDEQRQQAEASIRDLAKYTKRKIVTQILPAAEFYPAEAYHQDYHSKHPIKYRYYRSSCGRDQRLIAIWGAQAGARH